jgi:hypothetical protein
MGIEDIVRQLLDGVVQVDRLDEGLDERRGWGPMICAARSRRVVGSAISFAKLVVCSRAHPYAVSE